MEKKTHTARQQTLNKHFKCINVRFSLSNVFFFLLFVCLYNYSAGYSPSYTCIWCRGHKKKCKNGKKMVDTGNNLLGVQWMQNSAICSVTRCHCSHWRIICYNSDFHFHFFLYFFFWDKEKTGPERRFQWQYLHLIKMSGFKADEIKGRKWKKNQVIVEMKQIVNDIHNMNVCIWLSAFFF